MLPAVGGQPGMHSSPLACIPSRMQWLLQVFWCLFWDRLASNLLCSPRWPWPASTSRVLGLQVCSTHAWTYVMLRIKATASGMLSKCSPRWGIFPADITFFYSSSSTHTGGKRSSGTPRVDHCATRPTGTCTFFRYHISIYDFVDRRSDLTATLTSQ